MICCSAELERLLYVGSIWFDPEVGHVMYEGYAEIANEQPVLWGAVYELEAKGLLRRWMDTDGWMHFYLKRHT